MEERCCMLQQQLLQLNSRGLPSSFIYVVLAAGQYPGRTEFPSLQIRQIEKYKLFYLPHDVILKLPLRKD